MPRRNAGPRLRWRRGQWSIMWTEGGVTRERRTGQKERGPAEEAFTAWLVERRQRPVGVRPSAQYSVADILTEYAEEHAVNLAGAQTVGYNIDRLLEWWGVATVAEINRASCQGYAKHRRVSGIKDGTIRRELSTLSAAVGHAVAAGRLTQRPVLWWPAQGPGRERWLTRQEVAALLGAARSEPQARGHLPLFVLLAVYGGARKGAILELRWPQVDLHRGRIDWNPPGRPKTTKGRSIIRPPQRLIGHLRRARCRGSDLGHVLTIDGQPIGDVKRSFKRACDRAGLGPEVTIHTLRHTCGTWLAQAGVPLWEIGGYLGHTIARTTELYAHHHPDHLENARAALQGRKRSVADCVARRDD